MQAAIGAAVVLFSSPCTAKHGHSHKLENLGHAHAKKHNHLHVARTKDNNVKRGSCSFPTDAGLVSVTPNEQNAGWAMSPDEPCLPGHYCPYACPSGQVMAQWNPLATAYTYPLSMVCNSVTRFRPSSDTDLYRMVGCSAIPMAKSASRSQTNHTVFKEPTPWGLRIGALEPSLSARPSCPATRRC